MKKVTIYCEGGTTWIFNTSDDYMLNQVYDSINNPKNKAPLICITDEENKRKFYIRKDKVNVMEIKEID